MSEDSPDFDAMSDEEVKRLFMSLARDDEHRETLQNLINILLEEDPTFTEGEIIRNALHKIWEDTEPTEFIGHSQEFGSIDVSYIQNIYDSGNGKTNSKITPFPNAWKPKPRPQPEEPDENIDNGDDSGESQ